MKWFYDLKIGSKLILSFGLVLLLTVVLGVTAILSMARINRASTELSGQWMPSVQTILAIKNNISQLRRDEMSHLLTTEPERMANVEKKMAATIDKILADDKKYGTSFANAEDKERFDHMVKLGEEYVVQHGKLIELSRSMKKDEARDCSTHLVQLF